MAFSEEEYYAEYKRIRNRFRRYDPGAFIARIIMYINSGDDDLERLKCQPWLGTLLIKWILLDENFALPGRPAPSDRDFNLTYQEMLDLSYKTRVLPEYEHYTLFLRAISHQQFSYQTNFSAADFGRQFDVFGDLPQNHKLRQAFLQKTGLDVLDFLELSMALVARFITTPYRFVDAQWFSTLKLKNREEKLARFFAMLSLTPSQLRAKLLAGDDGRRPADEYYEQSPLHEMPMLNLAGRHCLFHPSILYRNLEHHIYDQLRSIDPAAFMNSFGKMFEAHVERAIKKMALPTLTEQDLLRSGKKDGNLVDFVIQDSGTHILVDAKGVTTSHQMMVSHRSLNVRSRVKSSALKAIKQAFDVQTWMRQQVLDSHFRAPQKDTFLIVVTYKELYLGNGTTFREAVAREDMEKLYVESDLAAGIPPDNIYFMSIAAFELLCEAVASKKTGLAEVLRDAREGDAQPQTHKFDFLLHLKAKDFFDEVSEAVRSRCLAELEAMARKHSMV